MLNDEQREILAQKEEDEANLLHILIISEIARRLAHTLKYTDIVQPMILSMQEQGHTQIKIQKETSKILNADVKFQELIAKNNLAYKKYMESEVSKTSKTILSQSKQTISSVAEMSMENNKKIWDDIGKVLKTPENLPDMISDTIKDTTELLKSHTSSQGLVIRDGNVNVKLTNAYRQQLDKALNKTISGQMSYQQATREAVKTLADSGVRTVTYKSVKNGVRHVRTDQMDVAVRRVIQTESAQLTGKITMQNCEDMGAEHVEVSSHSGARPTHQLFQGKIFALNGFKG